MGLAGGRWGRWERKLQASLRASRGMTTGGGVLTESEVYGEEDGVQKGREL